MAGRRDVALVYGFWGQNIGNAFFNVGGNYILDQVFGRQRVGLIADQPGYRTFNWNKSRGNPRHAYDIIADLDIDWLVLQGPLLTVSAHSLWARTLDVMRERGAKLILLGAGLFKYSADEVQSARTFMKRFSPDILVTRDTDTYEALSDLAQHSFDGVDSAFFVPRAYQPLDLRPDREPYIVLNFDRVPEPSLSVLPAESLIVQPESVFGFGGLSLRYEFPAAPSRLAQAGKWQAYFGHLADRRKLPDSLGPWKVIRTEHRTNPDMIWKIYQRGNSVASDEPYTYFTIYASAELVMSDRVHACAVGAAYGRPVMCFSKSRRAGLLGRVGLGECFQRPTSVDLHALDDVRDREVEFIRRAVAAVEGRRNP